MNVAAPLIIQFDLPQHLSCPKPTEERNIARDDVRLMITKNSGRIDHTTFDHLTDFLRKGDVLVVNTSATVPSALPVLLPNGKQGKLHVSTKLNYRKWLVEIREVKGNKTVRWNGGSAGMVFTLPSAARAKLSHRFHENEQALHLWIADFDIDQPMQKYLSVNAQPIQYENLDRQYPLSYYQTFFSFHPGSAEMPSAGRAFTGGLIERLITKGVTIAPILLHTGVSSLEEGELPYPEYMEVDPITASVINTAKGQGRRIIAVGTTVVRAIETAINNEGHLLPYQGNTELFIDHNYIMKCVDGLLTGFHEPKASHLHMLQSMGGFDHIDRAYREAIRTGYEWHQFGDLHLILP